MKHFGYFIMGVLVCLVPTSILVGIGYALWMWPGYIIGGALGLWLGTIVLLSAGGVVMFVYETGKQFCDDLETAGYEEDEEAIKALE